MTQTSKMFMQEGIRRETLSTFRPHYKEVLGVYYTDVGTHSVPDNRKSLGEERQR